jgi:hypothetical protein
MRTIALILLLLLPSAAAAQEPPPAEASPAAETSPDYSRDTLLRLFADNPDREESDPRVKVHFGAIDFRFAGMQWRIGYLPFFVPLQGSQPWLHQDRWPDPFILTGTQVAYGPRTWRDQRALTSEVRKLERRLRESSSVVVKPD